MYHLQGIINAPEQQLISDFLYALKDASSSAAPDLEAQKVDLGRSLFFDANLSLRRTIACSTCHDPNHGFVDARFLDAETTNPVQAHFPSVMTTSPWAGATLPRLLMPGSLRLSPFAPTAPTSAGCSTTAAPRT